MVFFAVRYKFSSLRQKFEKSGDFSGLSRLSAIISISLISVKVVKEQDARILTKIFKKKETSLCTKNVCVLSLRYFTPDHTSCTNFVQNAFSGTRVRDFSKKISAIEIQITRFYLLHQIQASGVCCRSTQDRIFLVMTYQGQDSFPRMCAGTVLM